MSKRFVMGLLTALACISLIAAASATPNVEETGMVAQTAQRKELKAPIAPGVELGFDYNVLLETDKSIGTTSLRTVLLEFVQVSLAEALQRLDTNLQANGYKKDHEQIVKGSTIRNYLNAAGDSVHLQVSAYKPGAGGRAPGSKGTMNITIRTAGK